MDQEAQDGIREKLRRADEHLVRLTRELGVFLDTEPYVYRTDADYEAGSYSVRIEIKAKPPIPVSITCGDYIHDLRCALEHLVGGEVPKPSNKTSFPLEADKVDFFTKVVTPAWNGKTNGPLTGLDPEGELFALIQESQPYRGKHGRTHHPLWLLGELSNGDKHRAILARAASHRRVKPGTISFDGTDIKYVGKAEFRYDQPLVDGDEILSGGFQVIGPNPHAHVHGNFPVDIAFGEQIVPTESLHVIREVVRGVIDKAFVILGLPPL